MIRNLFILLCFVPVLGFSQTISGSFKIINNQHPENEVFYITSITKANMEKFRLQDKEVTLKFENGFECQLLSAKQLFLDGKNINATSYEVAFAKDYLLPVFNVLDSGQLMAVYPTQVKQSKNKIKKGS